MNLDWQHLHSFVEQHFAKQHFIKQHTLESELEHAHEKPDFVVALSGGVDSIALFHLFLQLRENTGINFSAIHVNHGLSQYAQQWQDKLQVLCDQKDVRLIVQQVSIQAQSRTSLEQQARDARYQAIANALNTHSILFTGHHQSDQMETFLLRLMRGSGLTGLASMREVSLFPHLAGRQKQLKLARALLSVPKQSIVDFAKTHDLTWVEDDSNSDEAFDRNYARLSILPQLFKRWPLAGKSINTSTILLQQELDLLNEYVEQDYLACLAKGFNQQAVLDINSLTDLSLSKQKAVVRMFVYRQINTYPALTILNELLQQINNLNPDTNIHLKVADSFLKTHKTHLYLVNDLANAFIKEANGSSTRDLSAVELMVSSGKWSVLPENMLYKEIKVEVAAEHTAVIKWARFSEMFQPHKNSGHKKLNKYLKETGCPTWWRDHIPLVYINGELAAIADIAVSAECKYKVSVEVR
ncbi:tRNA(Ile)-lysidine synthase [Psychrosphaera saromensis]|uniref:tRNA(Ile)-lysidine synthase n=1 Tax=Psychrosphaera saromensis TaxID=716813 RepID=A0A2S7UWN4_9GAMM|nr:tRNA lysidine(34) synthetase TilS [Psychrosphaera saromensis]PQJ53680.1 tRNA lysidine(34) synthetase TilS [Psychrosphaera saromensis]GHB63264.1 tRNA(Ile)-lysidine synthase [Psychrosphaera saromensis]GLQ15548.1 tRNA(Ile)-lysidine synthase [Psychrosphaera saromensis]